MHKKIYFGTKPLFLTTTITEEIKPFADDNNIIVKKGLDDKSIKTVIDKMMESQINAGIILHGDLDELFQAVKREFVLVQAGGGLVYSEAEKEILLIFRRGKWDLPKGKLDQGEQIEACALREVEEETGLQQLSLKQEICITYHTYHQDGDHILKESFWYLMTTPKEQVLTPQTDEDIEKCEWVKMADLAPYLDNSFPAIIDVIKETTRILGKKAQ